MRVVYILLMVFALTGCSNENTSIDGPSKTEVEEACEYFNVEYKSDFPTVVVAIMRKMKEQECQA